MSCFRLGSVFHRINRNRRINNSGFFGSFGRRSLVNVSIESIKLKINDKSKGPRQIYGEIKVLDPLTYIFRRHRYEAQLVPDGDDDDDGFPLILCGPNHFIPADEDCDSISVDLYDENSRSLITSNFVLMDNHNGGRGRRQIPVQEYVYSLDGSARLTLTYTRIHHSYPFLFQFQLIQAQAEAEDAVAVLGTIRGIQLLPEGATNWITIFDSRGEAVVVQGEPIPLDRFYFIVPVQIRKKGHFRGGSFNIDVDLQLHTKFKVFFIKGLANVVVEFNKPMMWADHPLDPMFFTVGRSSDGPVIQISVKKTCVDWNEIEGDSEQSLEHY